MLHFPGLKHKVERREGRTQDLEPVPMPASPAVPKSRYLRTLDRLTFAAAIIGPFTVIPQAYKIYHTHSAESVSLAAWILIFIVTMPWIFYGFAHRDRPVIISFCLWEIMNVVVAVGVFLYR